LTVISSFKVNATTNTQLSLNYHFINLCSTAFVENNYLCFEKSVLDKACKDKENRKFDPNFKLEIYLHRSEREIDTTGVVALDGEEDA
jgi:hypothetical protein